MIAGAALLVLLGLGLFVAGVLTGVTGLYWGCVAVCVVAAVLLFLARRQMDEAARDGAPATAAAPPAEAEPLRPPTEPADGAAPAAGGAAAATTGGPPAAAGDLEDPPVEEVEVTDLLLIVDLTDEVLVIDEHPRYHLAGCAHVTGRPTIPLPLDEARADGFTPCAVCEPDRNLAQRARERKAAGGA